MPQAVKSSAWPAQFRTSKGLIWPGLQATDPTAGRPGLSGTLDEARGRGEWKAGKLFQVDGGVFYGMNGSS
jgi:hypothetical protein